MSGRDEAMATYITRYCIDVADIHMYVRNIEQYGGSWKIEMDRMTPEDCFPPKLFQHNDTFYDVYVTTKCNVPEIKNPKPFKDMPCSIPMFPDN
ncbi:hypothetical protein GOV11_03995 [Candidatus Woesearchaeota archaeon]|nr:hypothetical protein [Candidatus Woesearchaeota archaeon]